MYKKYKYRAPFMDAVIEYKDKAGVIYKKSNFPEALVDKYWVRTDWKS